MRLRSASMARARKCLKRKMFSRAGEMCAAMFSNHTKSCFWNGLRLLRRKIRPVAWPPCSKATVAKEVTFSSCCAGLGSRGRFLRARPSRRSQPNPEPDPASEFQQDRKSTRLNSSHGYISYAVFCLKKKKNARFNLHQDITQLHSMAYSGAVCID